MSSYKDLQTKIFERDNYTCQYCGKSSREYRALVMAHINNFATEPREIGCENMKYKMHRKMVEHKHQIEKQKAEV